MKKKSLTKQYYRRVKMNGNVYQETCMIILVHMLQF
jgi:hypothetical protein